MKRIIFFACCGVVLASCGSNDTKVKSAQAAALNTDLIQQNLKSNVKTITESYVNIDSMGKEKPGTLTRVTEFDEKGYQTVSMQKNAAGNVVTEDFVSRRPDGMITEFGTKKNGKVMSRTAIEIDNNGIYVGGKSYDSTGKQDGYYKDLKQNEYGIVTTGKYFGMNDKVKSTWDNKYDKFHFLGGKNTDSTGMTTYEGTAGVNDKGDMSEEEMTYVENGKSKHEKKTYTYDSYDSKGNWTQRTAHNAEGKPTQIVKRSLSYHNQ